MTATPITDETARALRASWFAYLDTVEPLRTPLHAYGLRLTGSVWDAEDLVQETLLRGFAIIGRGDLHGPGSPVADARAYLFRTATNLWIDQQRRRAREAQALTAPVAQAGDLDAEALLAAGERLMAASPQARAAIILKDVFEFSLEEIADQLRTTVGAVKAALSRGRGALKAAVEPVGGDGPPRALVDAFVEAFRSRDAARIVAVVTETCAFEVPGVGGGRGPRGGWIEASVSHRGVRIAAHDYRGEWVALFFRTGRDGTEALFDVMRLQGAEGRVSRIVNYCFCPDTIRAVAADLGVAARPWPYHQGPETLTNMIATTTLPWGSPGIGVPT
ncbi:RNA polymerase sigma factor [Phenylobacterium sp.]|jgi:RNA polymerase sigma-70 factor (ECF subfamily)|uniref:RNA polymerase sigma factor n=1 Tax=Phenylobacterium sp. TaxID=1871053 RepID=UPI002F415E29